MEIPKKPEKIASIFLSFAVLTKHQLVSRKCHSNSSFFSSLKISNLQRVPSGFQGGKTTSNEIHARFLRNS